jgi:hypothetical protein
VSAASDARLVGARVVIARPLQSAWLAPLRDAGLTLDIVPDHEVGDAAALRARVAGAAALVVMLGDRVDAALLDAAGPGCASWRRSPLASTTSTSTPATPVASAWRTRPTC